MQKLDPLLQQRALSIGGRSRVIVRASNAGALSVLTPALQLAGGVLGRRLPIVTAVVVDVPNTLLPSIASNVLVAHVSLDRLAAGAMERTGATIGATAVRQEFGYDGSGVGVAIVDSGASAAHDDLADAITGAPRVDRFVDFVNGRQTPYDDYGHGTHVAGIVAGNGFDSNGARTGIAPAAHLIVLKALDASGGGRISDVIAALDYALSHKDELNIRIVNLSVAAAVHESYNLDPLTLAAQRVVEAGIVVIAAAGNNGRSADGRTQYGGITAPGNSPWVLTVGASSHMGTVDRDDDTVAAFSSRGPTAVDYAPKPDLVAPGVGIESLSDRDSVFYTTRASSLLPGTVDTGYLPYLSLSGTSMAAPVVTGTVALMLQANPGLMPADVKAILEHTAQPYAAYDHLTQGAGFLDAKAAVELAHSLAAAPWIDEPALPAWNALALWPIGGWFTDGTTVYGTDDGDTVVWGTSDGDTVVWGTSCDDPSCQPVVWNRP